MFVGRVLFNHGVLGWATIRTCPAEPSLLFHKSLLSYVVRFQVEEAFFINEALNNMKGLGFIQLYSSFIFISFDFLHHLFETETCHGEHHRFVELSILWAVEGAAGCTWFIFQWLAAPLFLHRRIFGLLGPDKPVAWKSLGGLESCSFNKSFTKRLNSDEQYKDCFSRCLSVGPFGVGPSV